MNDALSAAGRYLYRHARARRELTGQDGRLAFRENRLRLCLGHFGEGLGLLLALAVDRHDV
jgi:hypothetical protein